jgi:hypothetical protein
VAVRHGIRRHRSSVLDDARQKVAHAPSQRILPPRIQANAHGECHARSVALFGHERIHGLHHELKVARALKRLQQCAGHRCAGRRRGWRSPHVRVGGVAVCRAAPGHVGVAGVVVAGALAIVRQQAWEVCSATQRPAIHDPHT